MTLPRPRSDRLASVESSSITNHSAVPMSVSANHSQAAEMTSVDLPVMTSSISAYNTTQDIWTPMIHNIHHGQHHMHHTASTNGSVASSSLRSESPPNGRESQQILQQPQNWTNIAISPIQQLDHYQLERNPRYVWTERLNLKWLRVSQKIIIIDPFYRAEYALSTYVWLAMAIGHVVIKVCLRGTFRL